MFKVSKFSYNIVWWLGQQNAWSVLIFIFLVAGIILVIFLYLLNFTITKGANNGIIFNANIVSINNSVFLVNANIFKPLRVFISFVNLDLGIETCFTTNGQLCHDVVTTIFPCLPNINCMLLNAMIHT